MALVSVVHCKKIVYSDDYKVNGVRLIKVQLLEEQNMLSAVIIIFKWIIKKCVCAQIIKIFFYDRLSFIPTFYFIF